MIRTIILCILLLIISGCSNKTTEDSEPIYNNYTNINQNEQQIDRNESSEKLSEPTSATDDTFNKNVNQNEQQINKADNSQKTSEPTASATDEVLINFHGIKSETQTPAYGNLSINIRPGSFSCLVCPDLERDVVYYANLGKDNYIYELKDGVSTLLLEQETEYIQLWKDELYFLGYYKKTDGLHNNIYKYNFESKQVETVLETKVTWMYINENGIYFNRVNGEKYDFCRLPFGSTEIELTGWEYFLQYKDYFVVFDLNNYGHTKKIKLINETSGEYILEIPNVRGNMSIYQDYLCYFGYKGDSDDSILNVINLKTGEKKVFDPINDNLGIKFQLMDYTIVDNKIIYILDGHNIVEHNLDDGSSRKKHIKTSPVSQYIDVYTDGSKLFAKRLIRNIELNKNTFDIVEMVVEDNQVTERVLGQ